MTTMERPKGHVSSYDEDAPRPEVGSRWIWMPKEPRAREAVEVVDVIWNGEEWWVRTKRIPDPAPLSVTDDPWPTLRPPLFVERPEGTLNDLGLFWQCVRAFPRAG